ncbi:hypothetical protein BD311DRAFT_759335 [Dichomitus squalens]|uniref:F-box domain-containing protein n=1 Tax=Dichomitus squalens TaxID=114155 RepID=A0A4Q9MLR9_9APHY|nr:hypothetical protein BD311DRAFT_759335 [Dichomitus squalens]
MVIRLKPNDNYPVNWDLYDLVNFLSGSPRLEEIYIGDISWRMEQVSFSSVPVVRAPLSLPRLRYLSLTYWAGATESASHVVEHLLSRVIIPPSCHLYFKARGGPRNINQVLLESVRRHVAGRDAVSHVCFWITEFSCDQSIQLVFPKGSLRLVFAASSFSSVRHAEDMFDLLCSFPQLFTETQELRVHYSENNLLRKLQPSLPAIFPNITALSLVPFLVPGYSGHASLTIGLESLTELPEGERKVTWPALDTLWVSVTDKRDATQLETALDFRVLRGHPIRHLTVRYDPRKKKGKGGVENKVPSFAAALEEHVKEITLMELSRHEPSREIDWMVRLPERYGLPSAFHMDWPSWNI